MRKLLNFPLIASIITAALIMLLLEINASICDGDCLDLRWLIGLSVISGLISGMFFINKSMLFPYFISAIFYSFIFAVVFELLDLIWVLTKTKHFNLTDSSEEIVFSLFFAAIFNLGGYLLAVIAKTIFERLSVAFTRSEEAK